MRDSGNTGPALGSEAVDARFWALICDDEEWLRTEFGGIVSEPAEHPTRPPSPVVVATDRDQPARSGWRTTCAEGTRGWNNLPCPVRESGHQRSPPDPVVTL